MEFGHYSREHAVGGYHLLEEGDHAARLAHPVLRGRAASARQLHGVAKHTWATAASCPGADGGNETEVYGVLS